MIPGGYQIINKYAAITSTILQLRRSGIALGIQAAKTRKLMFDPDDSLILIL